MKTVAVGVVLLALLGSAACGDDDADVASDGTTSTTLPTDPSSAPQDGPVALEADVPGEVAAGPVSWSFDVVNTTDEPVSLTFTSGQEGDAQLIDDGGDIAHTWSASRSFLQAIQEREVGPGERLTVVLDDDLAGVAPGTYTIELTLTVQDPPPPLQRQIEVVPG